MKIRLILADDHQVVRQGLRAALEREPELEVVAEADNGRQAVELCREHRPDVVLMDARMPELNGTEATKRIMADNPSARVLALSMITSQPYVLRMLEAGARGFLPKNCGLDELVTAIRTVAAGNSYLSAEVTGLVIDAMKSNGKGDALQELTNREREVLQMVAEGSSNREISQRLGVSETTVDTHRRNLMRKLDLHNVAELTKFAVREGITALES